MEFYSNLEDKVNNIELILDKYLPANEGYQKIIMEAMEYSVKAGGKRIRPLLMKEAYEICGGKNNEVIDCFAAAIEMLHTYSLVHDDLPAMDNDDYRRGRKTTHVVYGEAIGILAGDALLNYSYETASKAFDYANDAADYLRISKALRYFMNKSGIFGMIGGQTVDVMNENLPIDADMLDFIFKLKTGALLEASLTVGAILAGADDKTITLFEKMGTDIGLAFQIQDDILDVIGDAEVIGKPVLSDEKNNKTTYVTLYGIEKAHNDVDFYSKEALDLLAELKNNHKVTDTDFFEEVVKMLINRKK